MGHHANRKEAGPTDAVACPTVAIGASAGGLEALRQLFAALPADTGMAFIVIQHLDPQRASMLTHVLASDVAMPVVEVLDGMRATANRVHIIPPDADLSITGGTLELIPRQKTRQLHLPIDTFFRALAEDQAEKAIGVVLSGSASDGTEGLEAIKGAGGITFAQDPASAQFRSMPESAIAAGVVDFCLPPEAIAEELVRLSRHSYLGVFGASPSDATRGQSATDSDGLATILRTIRQQANLDFRGYKRPTLMRRIARRMALRRSGTLGDYAEALRTNLEEVRALAEDILIHVTSFFRDPDAFEALKHAVLPEILNRKHDDASLRLWVPGCSSGEEVYSLAICLLEVLANSERHLPIKIFGSDLSAQAIDRARAGLYSETELEGVSLQRRERFFERAEGRYRIGRHVRDLCVFVTHDLTRDPPFAKLDLISCRNVLIYFNADLQRRVLPLLHHCLTTSGYLFLGSSEAITGFANLFAPVDKKHRIFLKVGESPRINYPLAIGREAESRLPVFQAGQRPQPARDAQRHADHLLLARYAPAGVIVNERLEVMQFRGRTGDFLEAPPGQPQVNLLKMARQGLVGHLRAAFDMAKAEGVAARQQGVRLAGQATPARSINIEVMPLSRLDDGADRYFLVVFEEAGAPTAAARQLLPDLSEPVQGQKDERVDRLKLELAQTRDYLQIITSEHQDTTDDLATANEELIAANEELQSTNEELQSAKEELQSTNEELTTLNDELNNRNEQLDLLANDLQNVLESVQIPVIIVDQGLRIRRFTPTAQEISSLLPEDIGRSIDDIKLKVEVNDLPGRIKETVDSITPKEWDIQSQDGRWFRLHIRPYRTADNRLDGAILSFVDIDVLKTTLQEAERARDYAQRIVETVPTSLVVLDASLHIVLANPPFIRSVAAPLSTVEGAGFFKLAAGAFDVPAVRHILQQSLGARKAFGEIEVECRFPQGRRRSFIMAGCPIKGPGGDFLFLVAIEDITARLLLEASEKQLRLDAEQANRAKDLFLATLSHELRTPLNTILMSAQVLQASPADAKIHRASAMIERAANNQARLIDDLLDISRIVSDKLMLDLQVVDLATLVQGAADAAQGAAQAKGLELEVETPNLNAERPEQREVPIYGDAVRLQQVVANLLNNSIKFTPAGGSITVTLKQGQGQGQIIVSDTGIGIRPEVLPHLFSRFVQGDSALNRMHGGLGLGLALVRHLVHVHGGEVQATSPGEGQGATFTVTLPLATGKGEALSPSQSIARSIHGISVLLIDDDDDTRNACADMLEQLGATVVAAPSVTHGLAALEHSKPEVILCDIAMPQEDGYAFIRKLRSLEPQRGGQTPAAALTALAGEEDRQRALHAGYQMHLAKPIDATRLAMAVTTLSTLNQPEEPSPEAVG